MIMILGAEVDLGLPSNLKFTSQDAEMEAYLTV